LHVGGTYRWKAFDEGYNFSLNFTSIRDLHKELWAFKVIEVLISRILGHQTWVSWDKMTFGCKPHGQTKYYKGEGGGFTQVWAVMNFVSPCRPMVHPCTKSAPTT